MKKFPVLNKIAFILLNMWIINNKRRAYMKDNLLVTRRILNSNIHILEQMNLKAERDEF
jgi:hypothetical protein